MGYEFTSSQVITALVYCQQNAAKDQFGPGFRSKADVRGWNRTADHVYTGVARMANKRTINHAYMGVAIDTAITAISACLPGSTQMANLVKEVGEEVAGSAIRYALEGGSNVRIWPTRSAGAGYSVNASSFGSSDHNVTFQGFLHCNGTGPFDFTLSAFLSGGPENPAVAQRTGAPQVVSIWSGFVVENQRVVAARHIATPEGRYVFIE